MLKIMIYDKETQETSRDEYKDIEDFLSKSKELQNDNKIPAYLMAAGSSLEYIKDNFSSVRMNRSNEVVVWFDEDLKFIINNLIISTVKEEAFKNVGTPNTNV